MTPRLFMAAACALAFAVPSHAIAKPHKPHHAKAGHVAHWHARHGRAVHHRRATKRASAASLREPCPDFLKDRLPSCNEPIGTVRVSAGVRIGVAGAGRPAGCPRAWCGCWLSIHLGIEDRALWLARNWARVGRPAPGPAPGVIAVWRHHVGRVVAVPRPGIIVLLSGNDGHAVRERERPTRGVIAWRTL
jgi:hypothetical protein